MDLSYQNLPRELVGLDHAYGDHVHILTNPLMASILAKLGHPETFQPQLNRYVFMSYSFLFEQLVNHFLPTSVDKIETRMSEFTDKGFYHGEVLDKKARTVVVDLARAGTYPSHIVFEHLSTVLDSTRARQDHFYVNRKTNDKGEVVGVDVSGSKIGGDQEGAYVLFPDPMGATGSSISHCVEHYKKNVAGTAKKYLALHIIVTPEYIARMRKDHPDVEILALRLDRGLSDADVLKAKPGLHWDKERGLTDNHYIVPGAGGVGEVLNNSFV